ncbi:hypothetical protein [Nocardia sp. AG03]|uniref:hypothetical protein n=1 Tax=Nocardia sp. AG03 TaxID=3025312 RepID=UPI0024182E7F|nr:hypothetical protein [Nocardia sp. AG03]
MKTQRPGNARSLHNGLKLHRHEVRSVPGVRTVITLRPGTHARFSTNRFHDTWHVLSDDHGARLLAHLLWGLSYQARPGTVVLIDREFLLPTPFDADPADPIVLVPGWCTSFDDDGASRLKRLLPLGKSDGTIRWQTFGLGPAARPEALEQRAAHTWYRDVRGDVTRRRGLLVLTPATPHDCRTWALDAARLDTATYGTDYTYLDAWDHGNDGEIQVFRRFRSMVGTATRARAQVIARDEFTETPDDLRAEIWAQADHLRHENRPRTRTGTAPTASVPRQRAPIRPTRARVGRVITTR